MQIATLLRAHVLNSSQAWHALAKANPQRYASIAEKLISAKIGQADRKLVVTLEKADHQVSTQTRLEQATRARGAFLQTFSAVNNNVTRQCNNEYRGNLRHLGNLDKINQGQFTKSHFLLNRMERYQVLIDTLPKVATA